MGLRYYKRTKKNGSGWINTSASRRGVNASVSMQSSDKKVTVNIGKNGRRRVTVNLGNGVRYVKQHTPKKTSFWSFLFSSDRAKSKSNLLSEAYRLACEEETKKEQQKQDTYVVENKADTGKAFWLTLIALIILAKSCGA